MNQTAFDISPETVNHPTIYKRGVLPGVMLQWRVWTDGATMYTEHGQVDGSLQKSHGSLKKAKNVGKSNETTPRQQAQSDAKSAWTKKIERNGYRQTTAIALDYLHSVPMLAHKYPEHLAKGKIQFPVYQQPKLNGLRCLAYRGKGRVVVMQGRKLTFITVVSHVLLELEKRIHKTLVLDGELYCHGMTLNQINSAAKRANENTPRLQYHVYDITYLDQQGQDQETRLSDLRDHFDEYPSNDIVCGVPTFTPRDDKDVQNNYQWYLDHGFEGAIVRTRDNKYEFDTRSHGLLKLKPLETEEFEIIAVHNGEGKAFKWPVFTCANPKSTAVKNGQPWKQFDVLPMGTAEEKEAMLLEAPHLLGRQLTVRFAAWTEFMQPEQPRGEVIREDV